jgi:UDP-2,3-diacylglucosamine hydrolase
LKGGTKIYFASDFHLGVPNHASSSAREALLVAWLDMAAKDAKAIYLVGDIFDFWFEYKKAIPKGFIRILGKLAELTDKGLPIYFFSGNHDMWMFDYFKQELNIEIYHQPIIREFGGKKFMIGHGDGLGPGDTAFKFLRKFFRSSVCQWMFRWLHPDIGIAIAHAWSKHSRYSNGLKEEKFNGAENEWLAQYCHRVLEREHIDFFIFGHRHLALDLPLTENSRYINLGDWLNFNSYAVFDGEHLTLAYFKP